MTSIVSTQCQTTLPVRNIPLSLAQKRLSATSVGGVVTDCDQVVLCKTASVGWTSETVWLHFRRPSHDVGAVTTLSRSSLDFSNMALLTTRAYSDMPRLYPCVSKASRKAWCQPLPARMKSR